MSWCPWLGQIAVLINCPIVYWILCYFNPCCQSLCLSLVMNATFSFVGVISLLFQLLFFSLVPPLLWLLQLISCVSSYTCVLALVLASLSSIINLSASCVFSKNLTPAINSANFAFSTRALLLVALLEFLERDDGFGFDLDFHE